VPYLYTLGLHTVAPMVRVALRPTIVGVENIPPTGGALLVGNHLSVADEYILGSAVPRHIAFWAKSDYFNGTGLSGWFMRNLMNGLGAIEVNRAGGRAALTAFDAAVPALKAGDLVAVYVEGTRSPDGRLYRGRTGAARLALLAGVPVIPVGVVGTEHIQPIGSHLPKLGRKSSITFGKPMEFGDRTADSSTLRAITDEIVMAIQAITGQEYVPRYAPKRDNGASDE
jgi:1-acyl-sn-glycerol-3-phosphate acyltransferase